MITFKKREIIYRPYEPVMKFIVDIVLIICAAYLFVMAFFTNVNVVGHSMNDTLNDGDVALINKVAYDFGKPDRYDVIAFEPKVANVSEYYIKRIIGLPGETVQIKDGRVYIDGSLLKNDVIDMQIYNVLHRNRSSWVPMSILYLATIAITVMTAVFPMPDWYLLIQ